MALGVIVSLPFGVFGEVVGVICPNCLTLREQRSIRAEKARVLRRFKRGLPLERGHG